MKLNRLEIRNFVGIESAQINFDKTVSLFVGLNNQGKSSIKDAILYALTGKCRAVEKFKEAKELARGANRMGVKLDYSHGDEDTTVTRATTNASADIDTSIVLRYCLNPMEFIAADAKQRAKILAEVKGGGADDLAKAAIQKHLGRIDAEILTELKNRMVCFTDIDGFRDEVINLRREYKRQLPGKDSEEPELTDFSLPPFFNLSDAETKIEELAERIKNGAALIADARQAQRNAAEIIDIEKKLPKLKAELVPVPDAANTPREQIMMWSQFVSLIDGLCTATQAATIKCPLCEARRSREKWGELAAAIVERISGDEESLKAYDDAMLTNQKNEAAAKALRSRLVDLKALPESPTLPDKSETLLAALTSERDNLQAQVGSYALYQQACENCKQTQTAATVNNKLIAECDRIDAALKDGGPVKAAISAGGKTLPISKKLLTLWGMDDLVLQDNGVIFLRGVRIETCSESEKYRAASAIGMALADISEIGVVALDGFDILDNSNRNTLLAVATEIGIEDVLIFATTDKDYREVKLPTWLACYEVKHHTVTRIQ
jgi:DNA repair exonuclease SbcCD ATPase subunit